jgi:hypothetical protein
LVGSVRELARLVPATDTGVAGSGGATLKKNLRSTNVNMPPRPNVREHFATVFGRTRFEDYNLCISWSQHWKCTWSRSLHLQSAVTCTSIPHTWQRNRCPSLGAVLLGMCGVFAETALALFSVVVLIARSPV